jgi:HK97 family phage portal protein
MQLNYGDADFINTLKFNAQQIGALYGIPAWMLGILESTKFNNVETQMLDFRASTLATIGRMYRTELESKLLTTQERISGISIEFNWDALLEIDSTTRINNLRTLANLGVVTINDIAKLEGYPTSPDGDARLVPGNYVTVNSIINKPPVQIGTNVKI